jgi:hypothetical protein
VSSAVSSPHEIEVGPVILGAQRFPDFLTCGNQPSQGPSHMCGETPDVLGIFGENVEVVVIASTSAISATRWLWSLNLNEPGGAAAHRPLTAKSFLGRCRDLLQSRRGLLRSEQVLALDRQLISLLSDEDELVESGMTVSTASLDGLIDFLAAHRPHTHPRLSLTRNGRFAASWSPYDRAKLTLAFTRDAADWVGVDLGATTPVRDSGAVLISSLDGMRPPFRNWIVD